MFFETPEALLTFFILLKNENGLELVTSGIGLTLEALCQIEIPLVGNYCQLISI